MADSDLTMPVDVSGGDPLVAFKQDLNQSLDALRKALKTIIGRMGALKDSSGEVAERATNLANLADLAGKVATVSEETTTGIGNQISRLEKI